MNMVQYYLDFKNYTLKVKFLLFIPLGTLHISSYILTCVSVANP
jgi:hypothetical protein